MGLPFAALGLTIQAASAIADFSQARKQRELMEKAIKASKEAVYEAKSKLSAVYSDALGVAKEPYDQMREQLRSFGSEALRVSIDSDRGPASGVSKVMSALQKSERDIAVDQAKEQQRINELVVKEQDENRNKLVDISKQEATGAQLAARDAAQNRARAIESGVSGLAGGVSDASNLFDAYGNFLGWG